MELNTIPKTGDYGTGVDRHNDNYQKIRLKLETLENMSFNEKGYFETLSALQSKYPTPQPGWQAYVKDINSSTGYYVADVQNGNWVVTSAEAPPISVDLNDYALTGGSEKTVKEVEDEIVQLAGEKINSSNVQHPVLERLDFNNYTALPQGFTIENNQLVYTKFEGASGSYTAKFLFKTPNLVKVGKCISIRGSSRFGNEAGVNIYFQNANGVGMINQYCGSVPKDGSSTRAIVNQYDSLTYSVRLEIAVNSNAIQVGEKVILKDVVITDSLLNDFRGAVVEIIDKDTVEKNISTLQTYSQQNLEGVQTVNTYDKNILTSFGLITPSDASIAASETAKYVVRNIPSGTKFIEVKNHGHSGWAFLALRMSSTVFIKSWVGDANYIYNPTVLIDLRQFPTAAQVVIGSVASELDNFIYKEYIGSNIKIDDVKKMTLPSNYNSVEEAAKSDWLQQPILNVGTFNVKKTTSITPLPISNTKTEMSEYEVVGGNPKANKKVGKAFNLEYINTPRYIYHIGKSKKVYCSGSTSGILAVANSINDFVAGNYVDISSAFPVGIAGVREMDNGELALLTTHSDGQTQTGFWKTTDWKTKSANNSMPTWERKQGYMAPDNGQQDAWGFSVVGNVILFSEYSVGIAKKYNSAAYYSDDFGETFKTVFTIQDNAKDLTTATTGQHIHGCAYDPYWDRCWLMLGEASDGQQVIAWCDNPKDAIPVWTKQTTLGMGKPLANNVMTNMKFCAAYALPEGLLMSTDSQPNGIWRYNRIKKNYADGSKAVAIEEAKRFDLLVTNNPVTGYSGHERTITHIGGHVTHVVGSNDVYPILYAAPLVGLHANVFEPDRTGILYISFDGIHFKEIWREADTANYPHTENFKNNNMKAYLYPDGTVYIINAEKRHFATGYCLIKAKISL